MPPFSQHNFLVTGFGVFLLLTYFFAMQWRLNSSNPALSDKKISIEKKTFGVAPSIEGVKDKDEAYVTHFEPGIFEAKIPEKLNFPPDKILQEVLDPLSGKNVTAPYFRYRSSDNISTYEIGYIRLPEENFQVKTIEMILDDLTKGELARLQGNLKKESTVNESIYLSKREIEIESNPNQLFAREVLIVNRPYAFVICYTSQNKNNLYAKKAETFFNSFELFKQESPKTIMVSSQPPKELQGN